MSCKNPLLLDVPEQFESERLLIRVPRAGDGKVLNEAVAESFAELHKWMPWAKELPTVKDSEEHCRASYANFIARKDLTLLLFNKQTSKLIGASGIHRINWDIPKFEIGYWCRTSQTGNGYITEAVHRIVIFAFEELKANRVEVITDSKNEISIKIPLKLGFNLEGTLKNQERDNLDQLSDTNIYAVTSLDDLARL